MRQTTRPTRRSSPPPRPARRGGVGVASAMAFRSIIIQDEWGRGKYHPARRSACFEKYPRIGSARPRRRRPGRQACAPAVRRQRYEGEGKSERKAGGIPGGIRRALAIPRPRACGARRFPAREASGARRPQNGKIPARAGAGASACVLHFFSSVSFHPPPCCLAPPRP
jgi:hypothetical protein